jgi:hypothetical protein
MAANAYLVAAEAPDPAAPVPDPVAADFTRARILVHVNWQTVRDPANGPATGLETRFWHTPLHYSVTRRDYRDNPDVLFTLLCRALPNAQWARAEWTRGRVEFANPLVWPFAFPVQADLARAEIRNTARFMLGLDEQDLPVAPVDRCLHTFWLYRLQ